jgi:hypothetical protein
MPMSAETVIIKGKCYPSADFSIRVPVDTKRLDLCDKMLVDVDFDAIGSLHSLEELDLSRNDFHGLLVDLRKLEACPLRSIDPRGDITLASSEPCVYDLTLGKFPALEFLDLYENALERLDLSPLAASGKLRDLDVSWNHLHDLDTSPLGSCENLETLSLEANRLGAVSPEICKLGRLKVLKLGLNKLASLPDCMGSMAGLKRLEISSNPLSRLPDSFSLLQGLEALKIVNVPLEELPASMENLSSLVVLDARFFVRGEAQSPLLPRILDALPNVKYLDLAGNKLQIVPDQLRACARLTHVDLGSNEITSVPGWFDTFPELKVLGMDGYKGSVFPEAILAMKRLKHLKMTGAACPFPDGLLQLPALERMAVSKERMDDPVIKRLADRGVHVYTPFFPHGHFGRMRGLLWELEDV